LRNIPEERRSQQLINFVSKVALYFSIHAVNRRLVKRKHGNSGEQKEGFERRRKI
jgi:hypothetical protein